MDSALAHDPRRLLTNREAAFMCGYSPKSWESQRSRGDTPHPPFIRIGRSIRYRLGDLLQFVEQREVNHG